MSKPRVGLKSTSELPAYDRFQPHASSNVDPSKLSVAQRLVLENRQRAAERSRRRNTKQVIESLNASPVEVGAQIWVPDEEQVWRAVEIVSYGQDQEKGMVLVVRGAKGEEEVDMRDLGDLYRVNPRVVDDMTSLYYIHEAGILANLEARSKPGQLRPYTLMANVLIAVNPLVKTVEPKVEDYIQTQMGDRPPHPYAIAEVAFQQMALRTPATCQSIVISGESGAGKTETSKIVLRYLTSREYLTTPKEPKIESKHVATELDQRLWDTNPILEAFGNAKTLRNHNSSRFGKFMKLQFRPEDNALCGAFVETYLLEKFRVVAQIPGERNFHVFYFLLSGAQHSMKQQLGLSKAQDYAYLNQSGMYTDKNVDDELLFDELVSALKTVGIDHELQQSVFSVLAMLLHLGNIRLDNKETAEGDAGEVTSDGQKALVQCAKLLGVEDNELQRVITVREITTRGETFTIRRSGKEGSYVRDAIAKAVYDQLFKWILYRINMSLGHGDNSLPFIGVLDIFGFESFEENDFEQLLINYANEALQATFNQQVFIAEQELFEQEGIEVGEIAWPDNRECINLISNKPNGILPLLDQEAKTPQPSDEKWNATLHKTHAGHPHFLPPHEKDKKYEFIIKHFATRVPYQVGNFIDKNNDTIPKDLQDFVMSSKADLIKELFSSKVEVEMLHGGVSAAPTSNVNKKKQTVGAKFCDQMQDLVDTLNATRCNFIRCIKPNPTMTAGEFDRGYVVDQLRSTGMLATCELLKVGLPTRVSYEEICRIYKPALPPSVTPMFEPYNNRTFTEAVLWSFRVDPDAYRLGRTKVFFKTGKIALLDALLKVDMEKMGPWIVSRLRKWLARRRWRYATAKVLAQKAFLWLLERSRQRKRAILKMQAAVRMFRAKKQFLKYRSAHRNRMRRRAAIKKKMKGAVRAIQAARWFNDVLSKIRVEKQQQHEAARKMQAVVRGKFGRKTAARKRQAMQEAELRKRLEQEEHERKQSAQRRWKALYATVKAQKHFVTLLHTVRKRREAVEEARRVADEQERQRLQQEEEARKRREQEEEERQRQLALKKNEAARKIQRAFRAKLAKEDAKREIARLAALQTNEEAQRALEEAERAAQEAEMAKQMESDAWNQYNSWEEAHKQVEPELPEKTEEDAKREEELDQAGKDIFGEEDEGHGPMMSAEDENQINPVNRSQEFPTGPPIPYKGGILTCTMLGHRKQQDENWGDEYTEYVLRLTWSRDILEQSQTAWLVGGRYNDFNALHQELKAAASGVRGKRAPWFPRFPKRHPFSSMLGKNQEEKFIIKREKELNRYMTQVLTQMPDALQNIHMDRFLNLTWRTQDISEREAYAEARRRWEEEEQQAMANAAEAEPLSEEELQEVETLVSQLTQKVIYAAGDVRQDTELQEMIHAVKVLQPRVKKTADIGGHANVELIPLAMQLQDDISEAFSQYNDTLLALRLGQDLS